MWLAQGVPLSSSDDAAVVDDDNDGLTLDSSPLEFRSPESELAPSVCSSSS